MCPERIVFLLWRSLVYPYLLLGSKKQEKINLHNACKIIIAHNLGFQIFLDFRPSFKRRDPKNQSLKKSSFIEVVSN